MPDTTPKEFAIPLLPATSINLTLEFYQALGFRITYQQKAPNVYVALKIRDLDIHFFALKQLAPAANFSTCYLVVNNIDTLYREFTEGLKQLYGKLPLKGIPRINPLKDMPAFGVRQFIVVDPSGNYIRIGQPIPQTESLAFPTTEKPATEDRPLAKAYELGSRLADSKGDLAAAVKIVDKALDPENHPETGHPAAHDLLRLFILRSDIANRLDDRDKATELLNKARAWAKQLDPAAIKEELRLMDELEGLLGDS